MKESQHSMRPQDIVVLLKIVAYGDNEWFQKPMSDELFMSQSEVSQSIRRSKIARLIDPSGKQVRRMALVEFLNHGITYVFPQIPGAVVRGIPTSHSASPLNKIIKAEEDYVWPSGLGTMRGQSITPLYSSVPKAVKLDSKLHELLALVDAMRVGQTREKEIATQELKRRIIDGE